MMNRQHQQRLWDRSIYNSFYNLIGPSCAIINLVQTHVAEGVASYPTFHIFIVGGIPTCSFSWIHNVPQHLRSENTSGIVPPSAIRQSWLWIKVLSTKSPFPWWRSGIPAAASELKGKTNNGAIPLHIAGTGRKKASAVKWVTTKWCYLGSWEKNGFFCRLYYYARETTPIWIYTLCVAYYIGPSSTEESSFSILFAILNTVFNHNSVPPNVLLPSAFLSSSDITPLHQYLTLL